MIELYTLEKSNSFSEIFGNQFLLSISSKYFKLFLLKLFPEIKK